MPQHETKTKVAVVGIGAFGRNHLRVYSELEQSGAPVTLAAVVDVTDIPNVKPNDEATLLGDGITAEDHARLAQTIPYEILCGIHPCH